VGLTRLCGALRARFSALAKVRMIEIVLRNGRSAKCVSDPEASSEVNSSANNSVDAANK
jgi:hypothetical protein